MEDFGGGASLSVLPLWLVPRRKLIYICDFSGNRLLIQVSNMFILFFGLRVSFERFNLWPLG
jgi:hypothetical protein